MPDDVNRENNRKAWVEASSMPFVVLDQGLQAFPIQAGGNYCWLCGSASVCWKHSALSLQHESNQRQRRHKRVWLCSPKFHLPKQAEQAGLGPRALFANPGSTKLGTSIGHLLLPLPLVINLGTSTQMGLYQVFLSYGTGRTDT